MTAVWLGLNDSFRFQSNPQRYRKLREAVSLAKMMLHFLKNILLGIICELQIFSEERNARNSFLNI